MRVAALSLAVVLAIACEASPAPSLQPTTIVPGSTGARYAGVTWVDDHLVVAVGEPEGGATTSLASVDPFSGATSEVAVPSDDERCVRTDDYLPSFGGSLWWVRRCELPQLGVRHLAVLGANDEGEFVARAAFETRSSIHDFSASEAVAVGAVGNRICETIVDLTGNRPRELDVDVNGPGGTFNLADEPGSGDCRNVGVAMLPSVHTDRVAFLASTFAIGKEGLDRLAQPFDIYRIEPGEMIAIRTPLGIMRPRSLVWLDATSLLVGGSSRDGRPGVWLVDLDTGEASLVFEQPMDNLAVRADLQQVAGSRPVAAGDPLAAELVVGPVPSD